MKLKNQCNHELVSQFNIQIENEIQTKIMNELFDLAWNQYTGPWWRTLHIEILISVRSQVYERVDIKRDVNER